MKIVFDRHALNSLEKLNACVSSRIIDKIEQAASNPYHYFIRMKGRNEFRLRVGDYRVIADITPGRVHVLMIGHRKDVYR